MDSPLFPTIQRPIDITSSPSAMMSDLSLVATPRRRSDRDSQSPESSHASRASSSHSRSPTRSHGLSAQDEVEETPRKPRKAYSGKPRFSLFAAPQPHGQSSGETQQDEDETDGAAELDDGAEEGDGVDQTVHVPAAASRARSAQNEDKLRESLYELREMNAVFDGFLGALEATKGHNEVGAGLRSCPPFDVSFLLVYPILVLFPPFLPFAPLRSHLSVWVELILDPATRGEGTADLRPARQVHGPPRADRTYPATLTEPEMDGCGRCQPFLNPSAHGIELM